MKRGQSLEVRKAKVPKPDGEFHEINKYRLDEEWAKQPSMMRYYGELLAKAKHRQRVAEAAFKVREAELDLKIRKDCTKYGLTKITEGAVKSVLTAKMLKSRQHEELLKTKLKVAMLQVAVDTLEHRKKALEDEVALHLSGYFAEPRKPKNVDQKRMADLQEKRIKGIRKRDSDDE